MLLEVVNAVNVLEQGCDDKRGQSHPSAKHGRNEHHSLVAGRLVDINSVDLKAEESGRRVQCRVEARQHAPHQDGGEEAEGPQGHHSFHQLRIDLVVRRNCEDFSINDLFAPNERQANDPWQAEEDEPHHLHGGSEEDALLSVGQRPRCEGSLNDDLVCGPVVDVREEEAGKVDVPWRRNALFGQRFQSFRVREQLRHPSKLV
mmetsp:Transcript_624/g.1676  ORF Transcript_624/g.1676 Transcript_624/m.1676 type:complete len:203 (-) Transcript_624:698-1306(-)